MLGHHICELARVGYAVAPSGIMAKPDWCMLLSTCSTTNVLVIITILSCTLNSNICSISNMSMLCAIFLDPSLSLVFVEIDFRLNDSFCSHFVVIFYKSVDNSSILSDMFSQSLCNILPVWLIIVLLVCTTFSFLTDMSFNSTLFLYPV